MKNLSILIFLISSISCQGLKELEEQPICPEGYECNAEIIKNKSINELEDTIGKTYLRLVDSKNTMVFKYTYNYKVTDPRIADAGYVEVIYFEIPMDTKKLDLENSELSSVKLSIQKSCFCPDAGYEQIQKGNLKIGKYKNSLIVDLDFQVEKEVKLSSIQAKVEI